MPLCPKSSISRPFRLVMAQNNTLVEGTGSKTSSNQTLSKMFRDVASMGVLSTSPPPCGPSFMGDSESPHGRIHPQSKASPLPFLFNPR